MITIIDTDRELYKKNAISSLCTKAWESLLDMERGVDVDISSMTETLVSLRAMQHYRSGKFQPEMYFNVIGPNGFAILFSNSNNI